MGFKESLITSFKRIGFAFGGLIVMLLSGSFVIASTPVGQQPNGIIELICVIVFLVGIIMIAYAVKLKE